MPSSSIWKRPVCCAAYIGQTLVLAQQPCSVSLPARTAYDPQDAQPLLAVSSMCAYFHASRLFERISEHGIMSNLGTDSRSSVGPRRRSEPQTCERGRHLDSTNEERPAGEIRFRAH